MRRTIVLREIVQVSNLAILDNFRIFAYLRKKKAEAKHYSNQHILLGNYYTVENSHIDIISNAITLNILIWNDTQKT